MNYSVEFIFLANISGPMALHLFALAYRHTVGFLGGSMGEESMCNAGDTGSVPGWEDPLKKEMTTHSSIVTWEIPWSEKPGRLQSTGLQESDTT